MALAPDIVAFDESALATTDRIDELANALVVASEGSYWRLITIRVTDSKYGFETMLMHRDYGPGWITLANCETKETAEREHKRFEKEAAEDTLPATLRDCGVSKAALESDVIYGTSWRERMKAIKRGQNT